MARRPELVTQPGMVKGDGRGEKWRGSLDADIIIANAPDPVFVSDLEGKILRANDAVSQLLGFRQDEVLEQSLSRFISPEETREFTAALREVVERGVMRNVVLNPRSASGEVIPTSLNASALRDPDGRAIGVIGILRDMRELDKARAYAESLIKHAPDPVFVSDLEGKILQANDAVSARTSSSSSRCRASSAPRRPGSSRPRSGKSWREASPATPGSTHGARAARSSPPPSTRRRSATRTAR